MDHLTGGSSNIHQSLRPSPRSHHQWRKPSSSASSAFAPAPPSALGRTSHWSARTRPRQQQIPEYGHRKTYWVVSKPGNLHTGAKLLQLDLCNRIHINPKQHDPVLGDLRRICVRPEIMPALCCTSPCAGATVLVCCPRRGRRSTEPDYATTHGDLGPNTTATDS